MLQSLSPAEIHAIAREYFQRCLNQALEWSFDLPRDGSDLDREIDLLASGLSSTRHELMKKQFGPAVSAKADQLLADQLPAGQTADATTSMLMREAIARANVEQLRFLIGSLTADYASTAVQDPIFAGMMPTELADLSMEVPGKGSALALGEACETFMASRFDVWVNKTRNDNQRVMNLACEVIGRKKTFALLSGQDVKAVRDGLARLPKNATKFSSNAGRSLGDLIRDDDPGQLISVRTQRKYFAMFRGFLIWAVQEELLPKMVGAGVKVVGKAQIDEDDGRVPYSPDQLRAIFKSPVFTGSKSDARRALPGSLVLRDSKFWIPLIAVYSGMRLGEIAQLLVADIGTDNGVLYFDVNRSEDKTLKTSASLRKIPVHSKLLEIGFGDHVASLKLSGTKRLFPDIEAGAGGYWSHTFSKWWGRYARAVKFHTSETVFHSFRHNFKDALYAGEVSETAARQLMGHADRTPHGEYGRGLPLSNLKAAIDRVQYDLDLTHLIPFR
ncbi:site-specific integrase [Mesorhizobium sp. 2RAF45]|uniref:site-specific integrase n=1 Tax=Mesorhizobium sp. 2RAF45 TaxID=3233001 RepID=UPI003F999240